MDSTVWELDRRRSGLSIEWLTYPNTEIEVFFDHNAVLYRISGQIYIVPRQWIMSEPRDPILDDPAWEKVHA
jgi:hypothetical protein